MNEKLFYCQKEINNTIIKLLLEANQYIIWFSMLTQFSNSELTKVLHICKKKKIKLYIIHGVNPFMNVKCEAFYIENINIHTNNIYIYVNHIRYLSNEKTTLFGGIDYNRKVEDNYEQYAIKVANTPQIYKFNNKILSIKNKNKSISCFLYRTNFNYPIIGNTHTCNSAYIFLKNKFLHAKKSIIIESLSIFIISIT